MCRRPLCTAARATALLTATLLVVAATVTAAAVAVSEREGDFDGDGSIDLTDLAQLLAALGSQDARYDLDGSGRVDADDAFRLADLLEVHRQVVAAPPPASLAADLERDDVALTREGLSLDLPGYAVRVDRRTPFGISSLRRSGQVRDFANPGQSLADWEWLWFWPAGRHQESFKLIDMDWGVPQVRRGDDDVEVAYSLPVTQDGVSARIVYRFSTTGTSFEAIYTIANHSPRTLHSPYAMLGLPGFPNHEYVTEVGSVPQRRFPALPSRSFRQEAEARQLAEYLLLRDDVLRGQTRGLKGTVAIRQGAVTYRLAAYFLSDSTMRQVYSAHTNKPRYLSSHLYATLAELKPGAERSLAVFYVLTQE